VHCISKVLDGWEVTVIFFVCFTSLVLLCSEPTVDPVDVGWHITHQKCTESTKDVEKRLLFA